MLKTKNHSKRNAKKEVKLKKCKVCGTLFKPYKTTDQYCSSPCYYHDQPVVKKPKCKPLPKSKKPISKVKQNKSEPEKLRDKAWRLWSDYIREKEKYICFTCGRQKTKKTTDAGHYKHGKLDFDEMNIHCQCNYCNQYLHGNLGIYTIKLIEKYGKEAVDDLILRANQHTNKYSISELEKIIDKIKYNKTKKLPF